MKRLLTTVYRSPRIAEMYLYVDRSEGLKRVPDVLLQRFGVPEQVSLLPPTVTTTLPVGVPTPGALATTVKSTATASPAPDGSGRSDVMVTAEAALLTVWVSVS